MTSWDCILCATIVFTLWEKTLSYPKTASFNEVDTCVCGKENALASRIVNGEEAAPHEYPWMVAILSNGRMHCGGSLINERYVLTAGHCLNWSKKEELTVILGSHNRRLMEKEKKGGIIADIEKIMVHENFSSDFLHDIEDIGLIKLKNPVVYTTEIRPVCLPLNDYDYAKKSAVVTGWGKVTENGESTDVLRKTNVKVLSNAECRNNTSIGEHITNSMLCAYEFKTDACQGDSGGPLVYETETGKPEQIGIVSWGIGCAQPGVPGIYTRLTSYIEWIALHTTDANYCINPK